MTSYRIKFYDEHGALARQDIILCEGDAEAVEKADRLQYPFETHVLKGDNLVARIDHSELASL